VLRCLDDDLDTVAAVIAVDSFLVAVTAAVEPDAGGESTIAIDRALDPVLGLLGCPPLQVASATAAAAGG